MAGARGQSSEANGGFKENVNRETKAAQTDLKMGIGGSCRLARQRGVKIISVASLESWSEERRT